MSTEPIILVDVIPANAPVFMTAVPCYLDNNKDWRCGKCNSMLPLVRIVEGAQCSGCKAKIVRVLRASPAAVAAPATASVSLPKYVPVGMSIEDVRLLVMDKRKRGRLFNCPACDQKVKEYKRPINGTMALALVMIVKNTKPGEEFHLPSMVAKVIEWLSAERRAGFQGGDVAKLRHYGLLKALVGVRPDGSNRIGTYVVTDLGRTFVEGNVTVKRFHRVYNNEVMGVEGDDVRITDLLPTGFNYEELMAS